MKAPEPITQRPIVRPDYTDPRGKTLFAWGKENSEVMREYAMQLQVLADDLNSFHIIQYEIELMRREMKE